MYTSDRNNISAIAFFDRALDLYEDSMEAIKVNPNLFSGPAQHFQQALNRMITANVPDAHEMMRSLAERMMSGIPCYSEHSLLLIASMSVNNVFKDEIMAIPYVLLSVIRGNDPSLDAIWLNRVNGNKGIEYFLRNFNSCDIKIIHSTPVDNLVPTSLPYEKLYSAETLFVIELGDNPIDITLTAKEVQTVSFDKKSDWVPSPLHRHDKPVVYSSHALIRPQLREFKVSKTVRASPSAICIMDSLGCLTTDSAFSNFYHFKTPASLFACQLDVASFDSGYTWTITNVKMVPPSVFG